MMNKTHVFFNLPCVIVHYKFEPKCLRRGELTNNKNIELLFRCILENDDIFALARFYYYFPDFFQYKEYFKTFGEISLDTCIYTFVGLIAKYRAWKCGRFLFREKNDIYRSTIYKCKHKVDKQNLLPKYITRSDLIYTIHTNCLDYILFILNTYKFQFYDNTLGFSIINDIVDYLTERGIKYTTFRVVYPLLNDITDSVNYSNMDYFEHAPSYGGTENIPTSLSLNSHDYKYRYSERINNVYKIDLSGTKCFFSKYELLDFIQYSCNNLDTNILNWIFTYRGYALDLRDVVKYYYQMSENMEKLISYKYEYGDSDDMNIELKKINKIICQFKHYFCRYFSKFYINKCQKYSNSNSNSKTIDSFYNFTSSFTTTSGDFTTTSDDFAEILTRKSNFIYFVDDDSLTFFPSQNDYFYIIPPARSHLAITSIQDGIILKRSDFIKYKLNFPDLHEYWDKRIKDTYDSTNETISVETEPSGEETEPSGEDTEPNGEETTNNKENNIFTENGYILLHKLMIDGNFEPMHNPAGRFNLQLFKYALEGFVTYFEPNGDNSTHISKNKQTQKYYNKIGKKLVNLSPILYQYYLHGYNNIRWHIANIGDIAPLQIANYFSRYKTYEVLVIDGASLLTATFTYKYNILGMKHIIFALFESKLINRAEDIFILRNFIKNEENIIRTIFKKINLAAEIEEAPPLLFLGYKLDKNELSAGINYAKRYNELDLDSIMIDT